MSKKDLIKGIEIQAKADKKKMEKIKDGLMYHSEILKGIKNKQENVNNILDVVLEDKERKEAEELYGLSNQKNIFDLDFNEQNALCASIYTLLTKLENPTELQKTFFLQLSYILGVNNRNEFFDFANFKNVDSYTDRLVIVEILLRFLYLGNNSFEFLNDSDFQWIKDVVIENDIIMLQSKIDQEVSLLGNNAIFNQLKQIKTSNDITLNDEQIKEEVTDNIISVEKSKEDEYNELKNIVMQYISNEEEFGELLIDYKIFIKDISRQYPLLVVDTIIAVTKVKNKCLAFTTYAMYVWDGNLLNGSYVRIPYNSIDYSKIATAPTKDGNSRKLIISYQYGDEYKEIVIDDKKITEEKLMMLLLEIHNSNCKTSLTDFEIQLRELSEKALNILCSMIAYILRKEQRNMVSSYIETIKYGIDYDWEQIRNQIQSDDDYIRSISEFENEIPYPSKKCIIKKAIYEILICNSITNFLENKDNGIVTSKLEKYISLFSQEVISEIELNFLIKTASSVVDNLSTRLLEVSRANMIGDEIKERELFEKDIEILLNKSNEMDFKEKLLRRTDETISSVKSGVKKVVFEQKLKHASFKKCPLILPEDCLPLNKSVKNLGEGVIGFGLQTLNAKAIIIGCYVSDESAMEYDNTQVVIDYLHNDIDENKGIIEVNNGITKSGKKFVYNIIKYSLSMGKDDISLGVGYLLNFNIKLDDNSYFFNGDFTEEGITGTREAFALHYAMSQGYVDSSLNGWTCDPYNKEYTKGNLMNISELEDFDEVFKEHPLSVARRFVKFICENN